MSFHDSRKTTGSHCVEYVNDSDSKLSQSEEEYDPELEDEEKIINVTSINNF